MIIVRESFLAKPGQASKLAAMLKDVSFHRCAGEITGADRPYGPV